jgi:tetratricopeptide (TPR) repeat protein
MKIRTIRNTIITLVVIAAAAAFSYYVVIRPVQYNLGEKYYQSRVYDESSRIFSKLGNYKDSRSLYIRSLYHLGTIYYGAYNYLDAITVFGELADTLPGTEVLVTDSYYMMAIMEGIAGRYDSCMEILAGLGGYEKSDLILEAARNQSRDVLLTEHRIHVIPLSFGEVVRIYLSEK